MKSSPNTMGDHYYKGPDNLPRSGTRSAVGVFLTNDSLSLVMKNVTGSITYSDAMAFTSVYYAVPTQAALEEKNIGSIIGATVVAVTKAIFWFDRIVLKTQLPKLIYRN